MFTQISIHNVPITRHGRKGTQSFPIIKSFMESNFHCVKLDMKELCKGGKKLDSLRASFHSYILKHEFPIKVFTSSGELYFMRLDFDDKGNKIDDWKEQLIASKRARGYNVDIEAAADFAEFE